MSRSFGDTSLTTRPPIDTVPSEMSSSPATIRSAVVLPQPDGPTSTRNSPSLIPSVRSNTAWTPLSYTLSTSSNATSAIDPPDLELRGVVERLELGERPGHVVDWGARGDAEHLLVGRLAEKADRVGVDVHPADAAAREGRERAPEAHELAEAVEELLVARLAPRHRAAGVLAPL